MYTNLILFLVAIFLFSVSAIPDTPVLPLWQGALLAAVMFFVFTLLASRTFAKLSGRQASGYFKAEKRLSILSLFFYGLTVYLCDPKYYLAALPFAASLPSIVSFGGLFLFVAFLGIIWRQGLPYYERIFNRRYSTSAFIFSNFKSNLPIVLPWMVLSLVYDLLGLMSFPFLQKIINSNWGNLIFYALFLVFIVIFFPPLVRRLWGCKKLPEGPLKEHLDRFCLQQGFKGDFYLWPFFEGRVLTAAVMGIVPGLRYILLTPAIIETMSLEELESILAHEIGHVKKRHLLLYILLIGGFSIIAGFLAEPLIHLLLSFKSLSSLMIKTNISAETVVTIVGAVPLLVAMLLYFRFVFGYFIRNFERQADLFSLQAVGSARPLVSAFEKISFMSGNIREERNWHHFGIGERIDCLESASRNPERIRRHDDKVRYSLFAFVAILLFSVIAVQQLPTDLLAKRYEANFTEAILMQRAAQEPETALWQRLIGDLMLNKKMEKKALAAYEKAFSLDPVNAEIMNNYAWLLLTSEDLSLRAPGKALTLARSAATLDAKGYILDTLATAYWANGLVQEAVETEEKAVAVDPGKRRFYQSRIAFFITESYEDSLVNGDNGVNSAYNEIN